MFPSVAHEPELLEAQSQQPRSSPLSFCGTGSILYLDESTNKLVVVPTLCHRWDCPQCSRYKLRHARAIALAGRPERLVTLTTRPRQGYTIEQAIRWIRLRFRKLLADLRTDHPGLEYMAFVELHKSGWPHLHVLTRGAYISQRDLSERWAHHSGSFRVHIQLIRKTWKGIQEATKYYLKTAQEVHTESPNLPVYTHSRKWIIPSDSETQRPPGSYKFYCWLKLDLADVADLIEQVGGTLDPLPDSPGKYSPAFPRPPNTQELQLIYEIASWTEVQLAAYIQWTFTPTLRSSCTLDDHLSLVETEFFDRDSARPY